MNTKHTPGPWEVHQGNDYLCILRPDDTTDSAIHIPDGDIDDAHLIAAAPETAAERDHLREVNAELVKALEDMTEYAEDYLSSERLKYGEHPARIDRLNRIADDIKKAKELL